MRLKIELFSFLWLLKFINVSLYWRYDVKCIFYVLLMFLFIDNRNIYVCKFLIREVIFFCWCVIFKNVNINFVKLIKEDNVEMCFFEKVKFYKCLEYKFLLVLWCCVWNIFNFFKGVFCCLFFKYLDIRNSYCFF